MPKESNNPANEARRVTWTISRYAGNFLPRVLGSITQDDVERMHERVTQENGRSAANSAVKILRTIYGFAVKKKWCTENPAAGIEMNREFKRKRFLQPDELDRFFTTLETEQNPDLRDFVTLLLSTGVRKSNLYAARWRDVDFQMKTWSLPKTKNGESLTVQLTDRALTVFQSRWKQRRSDEWVFPSPISDGHLSDLRRSWAPFLKRAGIENFCMHDLRRTFASYQVVAGSSLKIVGGSLGHRSQQSTEVYAHLLGDAVRGSIEAGENKMGELAAEARRLREKSARPALTA